MFGCAVDWQYGRDLRWQTPQAHPHGLPVQLSHRVGFLKGKLAIKIFKSCPRLKVKTCWDNRFWARGYFVNTLRMDEDLISRHVRY